MLLFDEIRPTVHLGASVKIAIYAFNGITLFHLSVPQMVFGEVRRQGLADWQTVLFSDSAGAIDTAEGQALDGVCGLADADDAQVVVVPSWFSDWRPVTKSLRDALIRARARGAVIVGLCFGTLPVADTGILDGRTATTHWLALDHLAVRRPQVQFDGSVLYVDHGDVLTSAGTAAGIDACLHLLRSRLGAEAANTVARFLVVAPHRDGGQAQYVERPLPTVPQGDPVAATLDWALHNLDRPLTVDELATHAHVSRRTFVRLFREATGATPASWVRARRLDDARRLLEQTDLPIDQIAHKSGFGSAVTMRQNFALAFSTSPTSYRRGFQGRVDR
ncbi:AraC family transcriptional regulator [Mycolicibacterium fortuitum subsp. fortuitum]|nr:AraC family transcriptional regulator [Mycolicibacterium fortuitum subsp. fortuitum]CRL56697.1 transcriptional regulator containing an amidase domain and an AraC-type DNA-binding HTH domain protein [Mycolicibacterium fortuitum subsp. fortuitum DSM 46621 = ATCC 6841 = JCM 6387]CRL80658.1 transcriptional regulator containing an amidase domain and an AraC-type DNA-binding HTH domain protein [Mycolicibacter nonchromogenicus]